MTKLTIADLTAETVEILPSRETLFFNFNGALVNATNVSYAVNAATLFSSANSEALQSIHVSQH
jgi:hypothetical protein